MDAQTDRVLDREGAKTATVSELVTSAELRLRERPAPPLAHPSAAGRQLAPSEAARLVGDEVTSVLEAAHAAAGQIRTRANDVVTSARRRITECQRALDELTKQLDELSGP